LNEVSPWLLALGIVALAEAYSIGLRLLCRRRWGTDRLALNNEVAGFKFAVVGVFLCGVACLRCGCRVGGLPGHRDGGAQ